MMNDCVGKQDGEEDADDEGPGKNAKLRVHQPPESLESSAERGSALFARSNSLGRMGGEPEENQWDALNKVQ